jgi:site-specific DNA-methyltransferase (adenine-specific)
MNTTNTNLNIVHCGDNLERLLSLPEQAFRLVYMDPPFNTGKVQRDWNGHYDDWYGSSEDYLRFLEPRIRQVYRILTQDGTMYLHLDQREVHYAKVLCDTIFGRDHFLNEVIWAYDYGGRSKTRWPAKHDTILVYAKCAGSHVFNFEDIDRIPYMSPGLVGPEKAARGKTPTDVWWHTIVHTTGAERVSYPGQKPVGILERIIRASSYKGDVVLDPFAGSGSFGAAAHELGRKFFLIDDNPDAMLVMQERFRRQGVQDIQYEMVTL